MKSNFLKLTQKGITFVEILIVLVISTMVGGLLLTLMISSSGVFYNQSAKVSQGISANEVLSRVRNNIKETALVAVNYPEIGSPQYSSSSTQLILKIPSVDGSGNIITSVYDYFIYYIDGTKLRLKTFPDPLSTRKPQEQIFTTSLKSLNIKYLDLNNPPNEVTPQTAQKISITLTIEEKIGANLEELTATSEAILRND